jgi:hypothetical protein
MNEPSGRFGGPRQRSKIATPEPTRLAVAGLGIVGLIITLTAFMPRLTTARAEEMDNPHGDFQEDCGLCHSAEGWKPAQPSPDFDHSEWGMPLEGSHGDLFCGFCHTSLDFSQQSSECVACHQDIHNGELGLDCSRCHHTRTFFDYADQIRMHRESRFPLSGVHLTTDCDACHPPVPQGKLRYVNTPSDCVFCHLDAYEGTADPDHVSEGFSTDCVYCHNATAWEQAFFDHDSQVDLSSTSCVTCHQDDYDATTNPNHRTAGFPVDCQACHGTRSWRPATFDHDPWFPLESGRHREEWNECSDCHTVPSDYKQFSCLGCHPHSDRNETDEKHREERDYQYDSRRCYECHPRGRSED